MEKTFQSEFTEFLNFKKINGISKYKLELEKALQRNERTLKINIEDIKEYSRDLAMLIMTEYTRYKEDIQSVTNLFVLKNFELKVEIETVFFNTDVVHKIRDLKTQKIGHLLSFKGTVTRTSQVRPELMSGCFECKVCKATVENVIQEYKYTEPIVCVNHLCSNRRQWTLLLEKSKFSNWQRIHVQENNDEIPPGSLPRNIDVIVRNELVEKIKPGDKAVFTGHLIIIPDVVQLMLPQNKTLPVLGGIADETKQKKNINIKDLNYKMGFLCVYADNFVEEKEEQFTEEELRTIQRIRTTPDLYYKLSQSLFPSIHGHHSIKNAILLMLVGGLSKKTEEGINLRGDINILLVGDPGTAKSQFLKQTSSILPRSVYTSGKSSSAAGLTASCLKDTETGDFTIEAGALMLSDNGICCIDEFDKMGYKDQVSIHEAMEQQTITVAKAGIHATLNARTSILAAANPLSGRYDKRKTLRQNINLSAPIMSRFDLYFVLIDNVEYESDKNVANYILNNHASFGQNSKFQGGYFSSEEVKLYLKYVRNKTPKLNEETKALLIKKYVKIRQDSLLHSQNYKMTVRHLESMIRLSEALAKLHDDQEVGIPYVEEAYRLLQSSVIELKSDDIIFTVKENEQEEELKIASKDYIRITSALVYLLKTKERLTKEDLISTYLEENEKFIESEKAFEEESKKVDDVITFLTLKEGVLFENEGFLFIHPNYDA